MNSFRTTLVFAAALGFTFAARAQFERFTPDQIEAIQKNWPNARETSTSIRYVIEREGRGDPPRPGDVVWVHYVGRLLDGREFDKNVPGQPPFTFRVGRGQVIRGWDQILQFMKPGEKRLVIIPSELGYGSKGWLPRIPRDAALVFEIELLKVQREE